MLFVRKNSLALVVGLLLTINNLAFAMPIDELESLLQPIKTLKANFKQTVLSEKNKVLQTATGTMEFKRPNSFRWQINPPDENLVVTNGEKLWSYDAELEQVTVQKFTASKEISPISFLFDDIDKLNKDFMVDKLSQHAFKLTPRRENASFISVEVDFSNQQIKTLRLFDQLGQTSVFNFENVQKNLDIADNRFKFIPPAGVDVTVM